MLLAIRKTQAGFRERQERSPINSAANGFSIRQPGETQANPQTAGRPRLKAGKMPFWVLPFSACLEWPGQSYSSASLSHGGREADRSPPVLREHLHFSYFASKLL